MDVLKHHFRPTVLLTHLILMVQSVYSRYHRLHCLRFFYVGIVCSGLFMILTLNNLLITRGAESADILSAFLDHHIGEVNHSCIAMISHNGRDMQRIRSRMQKFSRYRTREIDKILIEEFKSCMRNSPVNPCLMRRKILRKGKTINFKIPPPLIKDIDEKYKNIMEDGFYSGPAGCTRPQHSTLFILPYRDRERHLRYWLHYSIDVLVRQRIRFQIILVEQNDQKIFNKGQIMNTAFKWAMENTDYRWDCIVFHDVDLISELYGNLYRCKGHGMVIHFARYIDKFNYTITGNLGLTVGGAVGFTEYQYQLVNGYSNVYWGWGGEDDDMYARIKKMSLKLIRYKAPYGRYKMIPHKRDKGNPKNSIRYKLLDGAASRMHDDGLSNLDTKILLVEKRNVYTRILVEVNENNTISLPTIPSINITTRP